MTRESFKELFDNHFDSVRNYIYYRSGDKELATDIAQETFMRVWEKQFDLNPTCSPALLYRIASNLFVSYYRKEKVALDFKLSLKPELNSLNPDDILRFKELRIRFHKALQIMPEKQRTVFMMSRMDNLKYHEIADHLKLSVKAVEKRMKLALEFLRKLLME